MRRRFIIFFVAPAFTLSAFVGIWAPEWLLLWLLITVLISAYLAAGKWKVETWQRRLWSNIFIATDSLALSPEGQQKTYHVVGWAPCGPNADWISVLLEEPSGRRIWKWLNPDEAPAPGALRSRIATDWKSFHADAVLQWGARGDEGDRPSHPWTGWLWCISVWMVAALLAFAATAANLSWAWTFSALATALGLNWLLQLAIAAQLGRGIRLSKSGIARIDSKGEPSTMHRPQNPIVRSRGAEARLVWTVDRKKVVLPVWAPFASEFWLK